MDEWLAAGDSHFLAKAHARMVDYVRRSSILVLATHSPQLLEDWCDRGILLEKGTIAATGPIREIIARHEGH